MTRLAILCLIVLTLHSPKVLAQSDIHDAAIHRLLQCLSDSGAEDSTCWTQGEVTDELRSRQQIDSMIAAYLHPIDSDEASVVLSSVLFEIHDYRVLQLMKSILRDSVSRDNYFSAMYLAKVGNPKALSILNRHFWAWPVSSWEASYMAEAFGLCKYRPAIRNLVKALDAASLNLSGAAYEALRTIFPNSPKLATRREAKNYFRKVAHLRE